MSEQTCRHCGVQIIWIEPIAQWWHMTGVNVTHTYRGCRDKAGRLTGGSLAEPEEKA